MPFWVRVTRLLLFNDDVVDIVLHLVVVLFLVVDVGENLLFEPAGKLIRLFVEIGGTYRPRR